MSRTTAPSAKSTVATLFAGPGSASNSSSSVSENVGFRFVLDRTVQTLSGSGLPDSGSLSGLLFVPGLAPHDPCNAILDSFIPSNVTRHEDVSEFGYSLIGLAPWISPDCTQSFLAASRHAGSGALVFYQPSSDETGIPPPPNDKRWDLNDGYKWRMDNNYPIYAIPGPAGKTLMRELSWFSDGTPANKSHNGSHLSTDHGAKESARLFTMIDAESPTSSTPALWSFVLAILGTIAGMGLALLIIYHCIQRKRRERLRQRIEAGDVDIEHLALNQITVPRDVVDKMPLYIYPNLTTPTNDTPAKEEAQTNVAELDSSNKTPSPTNYEEPESTPKDGGIRKPEAALINPQTVDQGAPRTNPYRLSYTQTTCAICLDDYVVGSSLVRELPCGHIFDPGCIDPFLTQNSSLCPLCKKSVLPPGSYQLQVTNAMVRQDQATRHSG